jgi:hypothetical protein
MLDEKLKNLRVQLQGGREIINSRRSLIGHQCEEISQKSSFGVVPTSVPFHQSYERFNIDPKKHNFETPRRLRSIMVETYSNVKIDSRDVVEYFSTFGPIFDVRDLYVKPSKSGYRYGFINFREPETVDKVMGRTKKNFFLREITLKTDFRSDESQH